MTNKHTYHLIENEENLDLLPNPTATSSRRNIIAAFTVLACSLIISCISNGILVYQVKNAVHSSLDVSQYARLPRNIPVPFEDYTEYSAKNQTRAQELWDAINFDTGILALPNDEAESLGLPSSQPFPWDYSRGVYLLNGYHNLHCLQSLQRSLMEYETKQPLTYPFEHMMHCLDALRRDVLCNADDTPRYETRTPTPDSGTGQVRMCRDWSKLEAWAEQYHSCWRYIDRAHDERSELERYIYCKPDSPYFAEAKDWARTNGVTEAA